MNLPRLTARRAAFTLANPAGLFDPAPYGFSHVAAIDPGARFILLAGQGGENEAGELPADFRAQVRQALANLGTALASAEATFEDVARLTFLIVDHSEERLHILGDELDRAWGGAMKATATLIPVPRLALDGMLFEIEALAARPAR